jgi:hypothetical protein
MKELPSMQHTFSIKVEGKQGGQVYEGSFTYQRPKIRHRSQISKLAAKLNEDIKYLDVDTKFLHEVIANLYYTITDSPDWWKKSDSGLELYDFDVIFEIYKECQKFEDEWFEKVWGNQEKAESEAKKEIEAKKKE